MDGGGQKVRILCREKLAALCTEPGLYWLIGSPLFLPPHTIVSVLRCLHSSPANVYSPDFSKESDELKTLLPRGFDVVGAFIVFDANWEGNARKAIDASLRMKLLLRFDEVAHDIIGAAGDSVSVDIHFFVSESGIPSSLKAVTVVEYEDNPEKHVWENGCLLRCQLDFKLPVYVSMNGKSDVERTTSETDSAIRNLRDPKVVFIVEGTGSLQHPVVLRGSELCQISDLSGQEPEESTAQTSGKNNLPCSHFLKSKEFNSFVGWENADPIRVTIFSSQSGSATSSCAPVAEYFPASEPVKLLVANFNVDILCYASKDFGVSSAVSRLVIPAVADQIARLSDAIALNISSQEPRLHPHHFFPPGILHPITAIYNLRIRESENIQVNLRRSLHLRVGLPLDRPLLLIANSLSFNKNRTVADRAHRSGVIKDIHTDIPRSCVSGGLASLVEGSYEYYHYLQDGFDDSGWGCAYRSLQTVISWFRIHQYTSIEVPSHREIQQALVDIGDKEPYFVGSREWIGAIELSFVLDKLLGVSCKIINVRSGAELPEKCRELVLHFETQGTPVMIGGGVLAYTLLGVDYNEVSGDCAFLILDPHYTGSDDRKKIINGGWCCWKKPVDSKGKKFFLDDKFYNLLLPQRPNMV